MHARFLRRLNADWDRVKEVWEPCMQFFASSGWSQDESYALCMTAQELLENAVKYGSFDPTRPTIELTIDVKGPDVTIQVSSPTHANPLSLKKLDDTIQWIRGYQSPFEAYVEKLKEVSAQPFVAGESGLGLARVAYEGRCILDFFVDDASSLSISAVYHSAEPQHAKG